MYEWNVEHDKQAKWEMGKKSELNFVVSIFVKVVSRTALLCSASKLKLIQTTEKWMAIKASDDDDPLRFLCNVCHKFNYLWFLFQLSDQCDGNRSLHHCRENVNEKKIGFRD